MTDSNKARECAECGSTATYRVAMRKDDESGLRVVGEAIRHVCAICGHAEVLTGDGAVLEDSPETSPKTDDGG